MRFDKNIFWMVFALRIFLSMSAVEGGLVPLSEARLSINYNAGEYISIDKNYSEIDLFTPIMASENSLSFIDLRGDTFFNDQWAASVGLGFRSSACDGVLGANIYYDYFTRSSHINFNQVGIGAEYLTDCLQFRINGYCPVGKTKHHSCVHELDLGNGYFATTRREHFAYYGFDSEVGMPLFSGCDFNFYGALGPYYYSRHDFHNFWGGMGRVELNWRSLLSLQVRATYDRVYSTNVQGTIELSIPLTFFCSSSCNECDPCNSRCDLYSLPVRRNGIVLTDSCCNWKWNWNDRL